MSPSSLLFDIDRDGSLFELGGSSLDVVWSVNNLPNSIRLEIKLNAGVAVAAVAFAKMREKGTPNAELMTLDHNAR